MKIVPHATFRFVFRGITSKNESLNKLQAFLHDKEWLPNNSDYDSELLSYHTEKDGSCEVILKEIAGYSINKLVGLLFSDLCNNDDIKCVWVLYNDFTDKLIQEHSGRYMKRQTINLSHLKMNDAVMILYRP